MQLAGGASLAACTGCEQWPVALGLQAPSRPEFASLETPMSAAKDFVTHAIDRLSYGARPGDYGRVREMGVDAYIEEQLAPERIDDSFCDWMIKRCQTIRYSAGELYEYREGLILNDLTRATLLRAVHSERQLYEVVVGFWSDHFNIDLSKGDCPWLKSADDREVVRLHALGNFRDLVRASALSPAMLWYLDGRENRKSNPEEEPNENYARELLELHTLGVHGGYTQTDVMELARCLTGWTVHSKGLFKKGKVEFLPEFHDNGEKTLLGHRIPAGLGAGDLDRVLDIVTRHPSTARFIATKLCTRFISDSQVNTAVDSVAEAFTRSSGDIPDTLRAVFATDSFRTGGEEKFKRPFRFIVSALRASNAQTDIGDDVLDYLERMGHLPFQYPTPDGYPEEAALWMGTMVWRWHFSIAIADNRMEGTTTDWPALTDRLGGDSNLFSHLLGRLPTPAEQRSYRASGVGPALAMASPGFQRW